MFLLEPFSDTGRAAGAVRCAGAWIGGCALAALASATPVQAQRTPASTRIVNTATLTQDVDGRTVSVESNTVAVTVETLVDVVVAAQVEAVTVAADDAVTILAFDVVNAGNALERFALSAHADDGSALTLRDGPDPVELQPGERRTVHVTVPAAPVVGRVVLTATAATGQGTPGTAFPGGGANGTLAVLGPSGGSASASTVLLRRGTAPVLAKSQTVSAPDGSPRAMPGSVITYRLDATAADGIRGAAIVDAIPDGTSFMPGSILLDDRPQSDAADGDAAVFDGSAVRVALGDIPAATVRTVRFQVKIK